MLMMFYVMACLPTEQVKEVNSYIKNFQLNFQLYGWYLVLFMLLSFSLFTANLFCRLRQSVDMWGLATKLKLNFVSLQQEVMTRMMHAGRARSRVAGAPLAANEREVLDEACCD